MKVLRIIASMDPAEGGPCQGIRNSIPAMQKLGIHNEVLCFDYPDSDFIKNQGFQIYSVGPAKGPYSYCKGLGIWLKQNLTNYDSVIVHGLWLYNSYGTWRVWKNLKKSGQRMPELYVMPHGMLDPYFQRSRKRLLKAIRNWFFWKLIEGKVVNGADGLLFTCEEELLLARKTFRPYRPKMELNVSYGVKNPPKITSSGLEDFQRKCSLLNGRPYLLFLSRIHPKKGIDNLIKAYLELKQEVFDMPDLVIAGPGLETAFGKKILKLVNCKSVHFTGMLQGPVKWAAFHGCEAFILPSHQENFGIAVVEALACAKPVLISSKVNIWREIENGQAGLVTEDTKRGVSQVLKNWLSLSKSEKSEFGKRALQLFEQNFRTDDAAARMVDILWTSKTSGSVAS